jgi:hypothetical protein
MQRGQKIAHPTQFFRSLLERENAKLKRVVAELSLEKQVLKDIAEGNF